MVQYDKIFAASRFVHFMFSHQKRKFHKTLFFLKKNVIFSAFLCKNESLNESIHPYQLLSGEESIGHLGAVLESSSSEIM